MELVSTLSDIYLEYVFNYSSKINANVLSSIVDIFEKTNWNNPKTSLDWNNLAVIDLIESEKSEDIEVKIRLIQTAKEKLENGFRLDQSPHCVAHYVIIQCLLGENSKAIQLALSTSLSIFQSSYATVSTGLAYLPLSFRNPLELESILKEENGYNQALMMLAEAIRRSQFIFYNSYGTRFLRLAHQLFSDSPTILLMMGISELLGGQVEGIVYLHHARKIAPHYSPILQSLYLGYRSIGDFNSAKYWLGVANNIAIGEDTYNDNEWAWAKLTLDSPFTYISFNQDLILTIEPSFRSIVTGVLVAQGEWFERELEFWRNGIQPNMTVIDVGANAGIYTFSAAQKVGTGGLVFAIEPFSQCVIYLYETCRANQIDWVKVCAGAASDRNGIAKLLLNSDSEHNEIIAEDDGQTREVCNFEEVECFTLDSLITKYDINRVDFLKIDAEGHELQVLKGSYRILTEFAPIILYENIAGSQGSNLPVADFLRNIGYQLFRYQPYLRKLIPIDVNSDFQDSLNVIALPQQKLT